MITNLIMSTYTKDLSIYIKNKIKKYIPLIIPLKFWYNTNPQLSLPFIYIPIPNITQLNIPSIIEFKALPNLLSNE